MPVFEAPPTISTLPLLRRATPLRRAKPTITLATTLPQLARQSVAYELRPVAAKSAIKRIAGALGLGGRVREDGGKTSGKCTIKRVLAEPVWGGMCVCGLRIENIAVGA